MPVLKPVVVAVLMVVAAPMFNPAMAGGVTAVWPSARAAARAGFTLPKAPGAQAIPKPVTALVDANGKLLNLADPGKGETYGTVTVTNGGQVNQHTTLDLNQTTASAIVRFNSFDVGSQATVDVRMPGSDSRALYTINSGQAASQIYGVLNTYYLDSAGKRHTGGDLYLINGNGILFGRGATVNVGSLFASTLGLNSSNDFMASGLNGSITTANASFSGGDTYAPENYVRVMEGASITTPSGGRVFLLAGNVENAGDITTPAGQTVLAAGKDIYLNKPSVNASPLYMSETNPTVPALKGLLVEVNGNMVDAERAINSGSITTGTGNTTIVGWAVEQRGRISATTSVSQNGSVYLLARSGTQAVLNETTGLLTKQATAGGSLVLADNDRADTDPLKHSLITITADKTLNADGTAPSISSVTSFTSSVVELSGKTIDLESNAQIVAPNATVNVRASSKPIYTVSDLTESGNSSVVDADARVSLGSKAVIDVSGTDDTDVSVDRYFVTTKLLGYQDLQDAPLQKDGPIYHSKLTLDVRGASPILGDLHTYRDALTRTAGELMSAGGKVALTSTGAVLTDATSRVDVSGGQVNVLSAYVYPSTLVAANGQAYSLNNAPVDVQYVGIQGQGDAKATRFGDVVVPNNTPGGHFEAGYVDGRAAGQLSVVAPLAVLDGQIKGSTVVGERQRAGTDALAAAGKLLIGANTNRKSSAPDKYINFGDADFASAVLQDFTITSGVSGGGLDASRSRIAASTLNASGFGTITITTNGALSQETGADIVLPKLGALTLNAAGPGGITLGGDITATGGSITAHAGEIQNQASGTLRVLSGTKLNVSGDLVNQFLDGLSAGAAVAGGSISLQSDHGLVLDTGSTLDVSGGLTVTRSGAFKGTDAGSITLSGVNVPGNKSDPVSIGATLSGYSVTRGGSLRIRAGEVSISDNPVAMQAGGTPAGLAIGSGFFTQGGFQSYDIDGVNSLTVAADTTIAPRLDNWQVRSNAGRSATGSTVSSVMTVARLADGLRQPVTLALSSSGAGIGSLAMQAGARILADVASQVTLSASHRLEVNSLVEAKGGQIIAKLQSEPSKGGGAGDDAGASLILGDQAVLDVSGTTMLNPSQPLLRVGQVLDGGTITVGAFNAAYQSDAAVMISAGATLKADGTLGVLDVARTLGSLGPAYTRQVLASNGGNINIVTGGGGGVLAGGMSAGAGGVGAMGGALSVSTTTPSASTGTGNRTSTPRTLVIQDDLITDTPAIRGVTSVSAQSIRDGGFADAYFTSLDQIEIKGDVSLDMARHLRLDAPVLKTSGHANFTAGSTLQVGSSRLSSDLLPDTQVSSGGQGEMSLRGRFVELFGQQALQGVSQFKATSDTELRLSGVLTGAGTVVGGLDTQADVTFKAQQVVTSTATQYTLNAPDHSVTIEGGDASAVTPLSGGSKLVINAQTIDQGGVLKAPFGSIELNATERITLSDDSLTSVTGEGMVVPYGETSGGGTKWLYNGKEVTTPPEKSVTLNAAGQSVSVNATAKVNLDGGGSLVAWEFIPGPGGSKDNFLGAPHGAFAVVPTVTQYAPTDQAILQAGGISLNPAADNALGLGSQITVGANGQIPAGTYAILPARYALLPGAYLVTPATGGQSVALGYQQSLYGGAEVVGGLLGTAGVATANVAQVSQFVVMSSDLARRYSEIKTTTSDGYFTDQAKAAGVAAPRLTGDAGRLSILADSLLLNGQTNFAHATGTRGGQLDIASGKINVGDVDDASKASADALNLSYEQLNKTGADSILLGGVRGATNTDGQISTQVGASTITVYQSMKDGQNQTLEVGDLILAAKDTVEVKDGVQIKARALTDASPSLAFEGDGALLRVSGSGSDSAGTVRTGVSGVMGDLLLGQHLALTGGTIDAEATRATQIVGSVDSGSTLSAKRIVLAANGIVVGTSAPSANSGAQPLILTDALSSQLAKASDLTLRSFGSVDLYNNANLGQASAASLTVDASQVRVMPGAAASTLTAGEVHMNNTAQNTATLLPSAGQAILNVVATGLGGGSGHVTLGEGMVTVSGTKVTAIDAAGSVVLKGKGGLQTADELRLAAHSVTATQGAQSILIANGGLSIASTGQAGTKAQAGAGAAVSMLAGAKIEQGGSVELPSGVLNLVSDQSVHFSGQSSTNLAGINKSIDGVAIDSMGGALTVTSQKGDIRLDQGGVLNVSAGSGKGTAGSMAFSASTGLVQLDGSLLATSSQGQTGGKLSIDSHQAVDLKALAERIALGQSATVSNFSKSIDVRNRSGDQTLAQGATLAAQQIQLSSDSGNLTIAGTLNASGDTGGTITLAAGHDLTLADGAALLSVATGAGQQGGQVALSSADGSIKLSGGSVDVSGQGSGGSLLLRVTRTDHDVAVEGPLKTNVGGASRVLVEGVKHYSASVVDDGLVSTIQDDADMFMAQQKVANRLSSNQAGLVPLIQVRAGAEVDSDGSMSVESANFTGVTPVSLTLRAAGDLNVTGNVSTGFLTTLVKGVEVAAAQSGLSGDLRLIGGADMASAQVMTTQTGTTQASAFDRDESTGQIKGTYTSLGDVSIGNVDGTSVAVRTTTGNIDIAAARDVTLLNPNAVVYTTGNHVQAGDLPQDEGATYSLPSGTGAGNNAVNLVVAGSSGTVFLSNGGSVNVQAGRDVAALTDPSNSSSQLVTDWWWRWQNAKDDQLSWWNRYDKFREGFATFGGGNVSVQAGRDAWNVNASALSSGYLSSDGVVHNFGGGSVSVAASRDVIGGVVAADRTIDVISGRNIAAASTDNDLASTSPVAAKLQIIYGNGAVTAMARNQLDSGRATLAGLLDPITEVGTPKAAAARFSFYMYALMPQAQLSLASIAGDLTYETSLPDIYASMPALSDAQREGSIIPNDASFVAAQGSLSVLGPLDQMPGSQSNLKLLARDEVSLVDLHQFGMERTDHLPLLASGDSADLFYKNFSAQSQGGDRTPVRIISELSDVQYSAKIDLVKGLRMIAGGDIKAANNGSINLMHLNATESSLLQAGQDIKFSQENIVGGLLLQGPGQLVMTAGRNIDLYTSEGIKASGNLNDPSLPKGSADITVMAGVSFAQGDITQATAAYFQLLGGLGGDAYLAMLYDRSMQERGQVGAQPFLSLSTAERIEATRALVGDAAYQAAVVRFMQQRYDAKLDTDAALVQFKALTPAIQATVLGNLLMPVWVSTVPAHDRLEQALALADQFGNPNAKGLIDFVNQRDTTNQVTDVRAALAKFGTFTVDEQAIFVDKLLVDTVQQSIAQAALLPAAERDATQSLAYNAIDAVFPSTSNGVTHIGMGASQIQTQQQSGPSDDLQGGNIRVFNPKGGINVGQLTNDVSTSKTASDLGIITAGGGNVGVIVRDDVTVNSSRIFTLVQGDEVLWSSVGSIDAGRGAKTAVASAPPVYYLDKNGNIQIDVSAVVSGSGILSTGAAFIAAPRGDINAGDAGIEAGKGIFVGGGKIVDPVGFTGAITGAPPAPVGNLAAMAPVPQNATSAGTKEDDSGDDAGVKRKRKRNILLDFLGFGDN